MRIDEKEAMIGLQGKKKDYPYPQEIFLKIGKLAEKMNRSDQWFLPEGKPDLFVGVDLGTSYVVVVVVDGKGNPVAGTMRFASIAREGLILDYLGAIEMVREMVEKLQN